MPPDIIRVAYHRGDPAGSMTRQVGSGRPVAGMYEDIIPEVDVSAPTRCSDLTKTGGPCRGFSSGEDGLCAGHRRQRISRTA